MGTVNMIFKRFYRLPVWQQASVITGAAVVAAEALTLGFAWIMQLDRVLLEVIMTLVITIIVGYPIAFLFMYQRAGVAKMARELDHAATTDFLTGLYNRRDFMRRAEEALCEADKSTSAAALLFIDIDHFKKVNDAGGHAEGDRVLIMVAEAIRQCLRSGDIAARIGGEEFAVLMPQTDLPSARFVSERIRLACRLVSATECSGCVTISAGLVVHEKGQSLDTLLREADLLLYQAKDEGRDRVALRPLRGVVA